MAKEALKEKYMELQMLDQQIKNVQQQLQTLEQQLQELSSIMIGLDDFSKLKNGTGIMAPLATGIFVSAAVSDTKELLVNVGGGVTVKKSVTETKELVSSQISEIKKVREQINNDSQKLIMQATELQTDIQTMALEKDV